MRLLGFDVPAIAELAPLSMVQKSSQTLLIPPIKKIKQLLLEETI